MEAHLLPATGTQVRVGVTVGSDHAAEIPVWMQLGAQVDTTTVGMQLGASQDLLSLDFHPAPGHQLRLAGAVDGAIGGLFSHGEHPTRGEASNSRLVARLGGAAGIEYTNAAVGFRLRADALAGQDYGANMPYVGARLSGAALLPQSVPAVGTLPARTDNSAVGVFVQADSCPHLMENRITTGVALQF